MRDKITPFVSVIIPVLNDLQRLQNCLQALDRQTYPKRLYEVIVVDNGSDEDIEPSVARLGRVRVVHEARSGSYAARNRGLSRARGEIIVFTDSDCVPASDWIEKGVAKLISTPNCGLVAGKVSIFFRDPHRPTPVELYESVVAFPQKQYVEVQGFGVTANLFTFKSVIEHVGPFDDRLHSGGDHEWGRRVLASGYRQVYADDVCVRHPARHSFGELYKKIVRRAGGIHQLRRKDAYFLGFEKQFFAHLVPPIRATVRTLINRELGGITDRIKIVFVLSFARYSYVWERLRLRLGAEPYSRQHNC